MLFPDRDQIVSADINNRINFRDHWRNRDAAQWRRDVVLLLAERLKSRRAKGEPVLFFLLDLAFVTRA
jgi:hypothetical protein